jgi:hypothetical protein
MPAIVEKLDTLEHRALEWIADEDNVLCFDDRRNLFCVVCLGEPFLWMGVVHEDGCLHVSAKQLLTEGRLNSP